MLCLEKGTGVLCDKKLPNWVKSRLYTTMVRPGMTYGMEEVLLTMKRAITGSGKDDNASTLFWLDKTQ